MNNKKAVFLGRLNPIHAGHEKVINEMISLFGVENCLVVIGSSNSNFSLHNYFSYEERRNFIKLSFPEIKIVGLPDYSSNKEWLLALDDLLTIADIDPIEVTYFGGCEEDIIFFFNANRKCQVINRFDGSTPKISATEIRDCLIHDRPLQDMINPCFESELRELFKQKWEVFKKI